MRVGALLLLSGGGALLSVAAVKTRGGGSLTREQFLLPEIRLVARLRQDGLSDDEVVSQALSQNLFQYPRTTNIRRVARVCLARLDALGNERLVELMAEGTPFQACQINLYAMMRVYPLLASFMVDEVGARLESMDYSLSRRDIAAFLTRWQRDHGSAAQWSDSTLERLRGVLSSCLVQVGLRPSPHSDLLLRVCADPDLVHAARENGDPHLLRPFDCSEVM